MGRWIYETFGTSVVGVSLAICGAAFAAQPKALTVDSSGVSHFLEKDQPTLSHSPDRVAGEADTQGDSRHTGQKMDTEDTTGRIARHWDAYWQNSSPAWTWGGLHDRVLKQYWLQVFGETVAASSRLHVLDVC